MFRYAFKFLNFLLLFSIICAYIYFPLYNDDYNLTANDSHDSTIEKLSESNLYIMINIGSENKEVKSYITLKRNELMIAGDNIKNHSYSESKSSSYNCSYCKNKEYSYGLFSEGVISTEDFNIQNDRNEMKIFHNMKFILGTRTVWADPPQGSVGLHLPFYDSLIDYNIIISLKNVNATNSSYWYFDFNKSKMIIDGFPHNLDNTKYKEDDYINTKTINEGMFLIWGLKFSDIYYDDDNHTKLPSNEDNSVRINFEKKLITAPENVLYTLEEKFFGEFLKKKICFKESLGYYKESFIYCKNVKEFRLDKFKSIYFKNIDLYSIFELNYQDLFYSKGDYIYFLIIFNGVTWILGDIFLRKYYLVFNQDLKTIGYYKNIIEEKELSNDKAFNFSLTHILLILIFISIIVVGIILYKKNGKRKNRANELDDDYEYNTQINSADDDKNKILDSN